jgi:hypothetical protein
MILVCHEEITDFLQLLESIHFSGSLTVLSVVAAFLNQIFTISLGQMELWFASWADREGTLSHHLMPFMFEKDIINITTSPTTSSLISNHICRSNRRVTMVKSRVYRNNDYISLFDPKLLEIDPNMKAEGRKHALMGSNAAQVDWTLFDGSLTSGGTESVNKKDYHIATILVPKLPPQGLEALAYIIEWKLIFASKNSHHHPFTNDTDHTSRFEVKGCDCSGEFSP